jgi:thiol-disulfide isomerase/thioredoxin
MTMKTRRAARWGAIALLLAAGAGIGAASGDAVRLEGRWDAALTVEGVEVPFRFEIASGKAGIAGSFFNGEQRIRSTAGSFENGTLDLTFAQYGGSLTASYADGQLNGRYDRGVRGNFAFHAARAAAVKAAGPGSAPRIDGEWTVAAASTKGEAAWRFVVRQSGAEVTATIQRIDGDTGTLTGSYRDGLFLLSHFSGARPLRLEVRPQADGSLTLAQNGGAPLAAVRATDARAKAIGTPTDPSRHTRVADASQPFRFSFPDLNGRIQSQTDARFAGKVLLVNISGSWCPNCHDEAPFLASLYRKYRGQGLEIVSLSFEEAEQLANPTRLRAFIKQYGIEYTVLLAGEPEQVEQRVPQAVNLNAFPTTFMVGRDGRVRGVHAGFPSPGSGSFYTRAARDITAEVEQLLAERSAGTNSNSVPLEFR